MPQRYSEATAVSVSTAVEEQPSLSTAATIVRMLNDSRLGQAIYTAAELRLADLVLQLGNKSTVSLARLASELRLDPSALHQLMRCLANAGIFAQESNHESVRYGLTALARHLLTGSPWSLRNAVLTYGEEMALARQHVLTIGPKLAAKMQVRWDS